MTLLDRALRHIRVRMVRRFISAGARVRDIGYVDRALSRELGPLDRYVGVDPDAPTHVPSPNARFILKRLDMPELLGLDRRIERYQGTRPIGLYRWDLDCLSPMTVTEASPSLYVA